MCIPVVVTIITSHYINNQNKPEVPPLEDVLERIFLLFSYSFVDVMFCTDILLKRNNLEINSYCNSSIMATQSTY